MGTRRRRGDRLYPRVYGDGAGRVVDPVILSLPAPPLRWLRRKAHGIRGGAR